ncbi:MAG: pyrimidine dimer DNA glycosylase/endonuclease V [Candidatus Diapherotrites archaeon]
MRLWSIHPKYLDSTGLVALWRESLLAKKVLEGKTKGYKNHPQLERFKSSKKPLDAINFYLSVVCREASNRGYSFCREKAGKSKKPGKIIVSSGQLEFELFHLKKKLEKRCPEKARELMKIKKIEPHPLFSVRKGFIEKWEKTQ